MKYKPIIKSVIIRCVCLMIILFISIHLVLSENQLNQNITENYNNTTTTTNQLYKQPIASEFDKDSFSWLSILSAFGPLIAALIAYFTLRELKIQRELSDDPKIYVIPPIKNSLKVSSIKLDDFDTPLPIRWEGDAIESQNSDFPLSVRIPLEAVNTGVGTAFNVKIRLKSENMSEYLNNINKLHPNFKYRINENSFHEISTDKSKILINPQSFSPKIEEPYIFPYSSIQNNVKIYLPDHFLFLASIAIASIKSSKERMEMLLPFPSIVGIIEYSDLGGTKHKSKFKVKLNFLQITSKENLVKNASFYLTVKMKQEKSYITDLLSKIFGKIATYLRLN